MPILNLKNITIKKLQDKNLNPHFLRINNDSLDEAYFCFEWTVREGWTNLINNWDNIKEVEIEFEEKENDYRTYRKVISLYAPQENEIII